MAYARQHAPQMAVNASHFFVGPLIRTRQTLQSFQEGLGITGTIHDPIDEIGNDEWFNQITSNQEMMKLYKGGMSCYTAIELTFPAEITQDWNATALSAVQQMFAEMADGETGLAVGHDPTVQMAAIALGTDPGVLKECEYVVFIQDGDSIRVGGKYFN